MLDAPGYAILERLHRGARSQVYRAQHVASGLGVILKLPISEFPSPREKNALRLEYQTLTMLRGRGAIKALGLERLGNAPLLVLEDVGGRDLEGYAEGRPSLEEMLGLAAAVARALANVHGADIVHGDICASNILRTPLSGQALLIDFSTAHGPALERPLPHALGRPTHLAPELAGHPDRHHTPATDIYALGVTFYRLLTGRFPFESADTLELVHAHLTKVPPPPSAIETQLPETVGALVLKCLAKAPEHRYRSAAGLAADIEECLRKLKVLGRIKRFPLGQKDVSDVLVPVPGLVGRKREQCILGEAFQRARQGGFEAVLVSGYSGIGKTSLVEALRRPAWSHQAFFLDGKFEALRRDIPYTAPAKALGKAVRQILGEPQERLAALREDLGTALGDDARLLVEVVPELQRVIGQKPPVILGGPREAKVRLARLFCAMLRTITRPDRSAILFFDDLQWADADSLELLSAVFEAGDLPRCLVIAAYRINEIDANPQAKAFVEALAQGRHPVARLSLAGLDVSETAEMLHRANPHSPGALLEAAAIIHAKTGGNPFFIGELLRDKAVRSALGGHPQADRPGVDIAVLQAAAATDNIAEATAQALGRLPALSRRALSLAACLGSRFDGLFLARLLDVPGEQVLDLFRPCLEENMLLPDREAPGTGEDGVWSLRFAHDKIQEAALTRLGPDERTKAHERLGHFLLRTFPPERHPERIFDIADQFLLAKSRFTAAADRMTFGRISLQAAQRAMDAAAYPGAWTHAAAGMEVLGTDGWVLCPDLALGLWSAGAKASLFAGLYPEFEAVCLQGLGYAVAPVDQACFLALRARFHAVLGNNKASVEDARQALSGLGTLPTPDNMEPETGRMLDDILGILAKTPLASFLDAPLTTDSRAMAEMAVVDAAVLAVMGIDFAFYVYLIVRTTFLQLTLGLFPPAFPGLAAFGYLLLFKQRDYARAVEFAELALALCRKHLHYDAFLAIIEVACNSILPHVKSISSLYSLINEATDIADASGSYYWRAIHASTKLNIDFVVGKNLHEIHESVNDIASYSQKYRFVLGLLWGGAIHFGLSSLVTNGHGSRIVLQGMTEGKFIRQSISRNQGEILAVYKTIKMAACYYRRRFKSAWGIYRYRKSSPLSDISCLEMMDQRFYAAMSLAAFCDTADAAFRDAHLPFLQESVAMFREFAASCPENFSSRLLLMEAELARRLGTDRQAPLPLYEHAAAAARRDGFLHIEALAHELSGRFLLSLEHHGEARRELQKAAAGYKAWGASTVVESMRREFQDFLVTPATTAKAVGNDFGLLSPDSLDYLAIIKAARAISSEMDPARLVPLLMRLLLQAAGAERGAFFTIEPDGPKAAVVSSVEDQRRFVPIDAQWTPEQDVAISVVRYAARTAETIVLHDAASDPAFEADYRVRLVPLRSVLCLPIPGREGLLGLIYLENNQIPGAFTTSHLDTVRTLAAQAAVSLENASLFKTLRTAEEKYRSIVTNAPLGIFQATPDDLLRSVNPALASMLGFTTSEEMLRKASRLSDYFISKTDHARLTKELATGREIKAIEAHWRRRDGIFLWVRLHIRTIIGHDGQVHHFEGMVEDVAEEKKSKEQIRKLNQEMLRIQDMERARVAMELHDDVAQNLLAAKLDLTQLANRPILADDTAIRHDVDRLTDALTRSLSSVRDLSHALRPPDLDRLGLVGALAAFCRDTAARTGLEIDFLTAGIESLTLDYETQTHCFRLFQEAVNNAVRHSGAKRITVRLAASHPKLIARIEDDGRGFDVAARSVAAIEGKRMGLRSMQERAGFIGGQLRIVSRDGHGTRVIMEAILRGQEHDA